MGVMFLSRLFSVCLFGGISQTLLNGFAWNFLLMLVMGKGRTDLTLFKKYVYILFNIPDKKMQVFWMHSFNSVKPSVPMNSHKWRLILPQSNNTGELGCWFWNVLLNRYSFEDSPAMPFDIIRNILDQGLPKLSMAWSPFCKMSLKNPLTIL